MAFWVTLPATVALQIYEYLHIYIYDMYTYTADLQNCNHVKCLSSSCSSWGTISLFFMAEVGLHRLKMKAQGELIRAVPSYYHVLPRH